MSDKLNGILLINKPANITSFGVIAKLRKSLNIKKIGHSGTLDPNATGLLVIMIGQSTKLLPYLDYQDKTYEFSMKLGIKTSTGDVWGEVIEKAEIPHITNKDIIDVFKSFIGEYQQLPPMVSAIKINGKKLYEYARENIEVTRQSRVVQIKKLDFITNEVNKIKGVVVCSKGTYVRTLCEDIAKRLNTVGTMTSLNRLKIGELSLASAYTIEMVDQGDYNLLNAKTVLKDYELIKYDKIEDILNGKKILLDTNSDIVAIEYDNDVIAIYKRERENLFRCDRGLW